MGDGAWNTSYMHYSLMMRVKKGEHGVHGGLLSAHVQDSLLGYLKARRAPHGALYCNRVACGELQCIDYGVMTIGGS